MLDDIGVIPSLKDNTPLLLIELDQINLPIYRFFGGIKGENVVLKIGGFLACLI